MVDIGSTDERLREFREFDESKAGVKGLFDAGLTKIPRMFHCLEELSTGSSKAKSGSQFSIPVIDLNGIHEGSISRRNVVDKIRSASERYGFFQVINHGIPVEILDEMIEGIRRFHEQDAEVKKLFYSRDPKRKVLYFSNYDLYQSPAAFWKDTLVCVMSPNQPEPEELPLICR